MICHRNAYELVFLENYFIQAESLLRSLEQATGCISFNTSLIKQITYVLSKYVPPQTDQLSNLVDTDLHVSVTTPYLQ